MCLEDWFDIEDIDMKRYHIANLIKEVMHEQNVVHIKPPKIKMTVRKRVIEQHTEDMHEESQCKKKAGQKVSAQKQYSKNESKHKSLPPTENYKGNGNDSDAFEDKESSKITGSKRKGGKSNIHSNKSDLQNKDVNNGRNNKSKNEKQITMEGQSGCKTHKKSYLKINGKSLEAVTEQQISNVDAKDAEPNSVLLPEPMSASNSSTTSRESSPLGFEDSRLPIAVAASETTNDSNSEQSCSGSLILDDGTKLSNGKYITNILCPEPMAASEYSNSSVDADVELEQNSSKSEDDILLPEEQAPKKRRKRRGN